jgi:hypothetical protein
MKERAVTDKAIGTLLAACLALCCLAPPASAQEGQAPAPPGIGLRSEKTAFTWSLAGTLIAWGLVFLPRLLSGDSMDGTAHIRGYVAVVGIPIGPSLGHFYAGSTGQAIASIVVRCIGMIVWMAGGIGESDTLVLFGLGIMAVSSAVDVATVKAAVRRYNLKAGRASVALSPVVSPRSKSLGLQLRIGF